MNTKLNPKAPAVAGTLALFLAACFFLPVARCAAADSISSSVETAAKDAKVAVEEAGHAAADKIDQLWQSIERSRIKNRSRDEIVAWIIMGILVGGVVGTFSAYGTSFLGRGINLLFGLIGAFLGGVLANLTHLDLGLGPVLIRYEELLLAFIGASAIVLISRWMRYKASRKKEAPK